MKIKRIEHIDDFGINEHVCWAEVAGVPNEFIEEAVAIDKENYNEGCFGICVGQDEDGWYISQEEPGSELFYIDNDGDKHWMNYKLTKTEEVNAIEFCKNYLEEEE